MYSCLFFPYIIYHLSLFDNRQLFFLGSTLANYTPKAGISTEDFQLGVTRTTPITTPKSEPEKNEEEQSILKEVEQPMLFSAGTNSDILFWKDFAHLMVC